MNDLEKQLASQSKLLEEKDMELDAVIKANKELVGINERQEKRISELEAAVKEEHGSIVSAALREIDKVRKENAALTAKVKKLEKQVEELEAKLANPFGLDAIRELEWKIAKAKAIVKEAGHDNVDDSPSCELCRIWKALEGD